MELLYYTTALYTCFILPYSILNNVLYIYCLAYGINIGLLQTFTLVLVYIVSDWGKPVNYSFVLIQTHTL